MNEENKKMGFFSKLKTSIFKLEEYDHFLEQKFSEAFKYFVILILILTTIFSIVYTSEYSKQLTKAFSYIKNEMPDFTYDDNTLKFSNNVEAYDEEYNTRLFINTDDEVSNEKIEEYEKKLSSDSLGIIALKDKFIMFTGNTKAEYNYSDFETILGNDKVTNKQSLIDTIDSIGMNSITFGIFLEILLVYFIQNIIELFIYVLIVAMFGQIASGFARVKFPIKTILVLAVYSVTLPNILYESYIIANLLTGFYVEYFAIFYMLICCVYIFTAIFMIKSDIIRGQQEIQAINEVQKQVKEEAEEIIDNKEPKENKEENKDDKKDKESDSDENPVIDENREPDGSEI